MTQPGGERPCRRRGRQRMARRRQRGEMLCGRRARVQQRDAEHDDEHVEEAEVAHQLNRDHQPGEAAGGEPARPAGHEHEERQDDLRHEQQRERSRQQRPRQADRAPSERRRHRLADQKASEVERIAQRLARELRLAEAEHQAEQQPMHRQHQDRLRRARHRPRRQRRERREKDREEAGLEQQRFPRVAQAEGRVEAQVQHPRDREHRGRQDAARRQDRGGGAGERKRPEHRVAGRDPEQRRMPRHGAPRAEALAHARQLLGQRVDAPDAGPRENLVAQRHERDDVDEREEPREDAPDDLSRHGAQRTRSRSRAARGSPSLRARGSSGTRAARAMRSCDRGGRRRRALR